MLWSVSARATETTSWHSHDVVEFIYCRTTAGHLEVDGRRIDFVRGRTVFVAPGVSHRIVLRPGEVADLKAICMHAEDIAAHLSPLHAALLAEMHATGISLADHLPNESYLAATLALIPDGFGSTGETDARIVWGAIGLLLGLHGRACDSPENQGRRRHGDKIKEICRWIEPRLAEDIGLDAVAAEFALSRSLLTREFRRHTGRSFVDYCNTRRVEKAAQALATGDKSITEVALDSGFGNLSHFHRLFKSHYGLTPAAFRRQIGGMGQGEAQLQAA